VAGLSVVGRDKYGVFPLRGKLLNVRVASSKQMVDNAELSNVIEILGLRHGVDYSKAVNREKLRYGRVILMTDQDHDGTHIKALFVNFLSHLWPSLLHANDFLDTFITPLIKVTKGKSKKQTPLLFYSVPEYEEWKKALREAEDSSSSFSSSSLSSSSSPSASSFTAKYYKGLGTNTAEEARSYFSDLPKHLKRFTYADEADDALIDMAFAK
jgi:DNA topoisomerase-2